MPSIGIETVLAYDWERAEEYSRNEGVTSGGVYQITVDQEEDIHDPKQVLDKRSVAEPFTWVLYLKHRILDLEVGTHEGSHLSRVQ